MPELLEKLHPRYIVDEKGHKTAVIIDLGEYENFVELIEDLEDSQDLLKAKLEATNFTPYDEFRKKWLTP